MGEFYTATFGDRVYFMWTGSPIARTDYPTLLYLGKCEPPLGVGSKASLGRYRVVVMAEEPETATVLVRWHGLWGWLHEVVWRLLHGR
jgi:hypothetical protein